ncbi:hypothetical protein MMC18_009691 [Xylographa bjoerkii]|nr:hypothetical protein [Xylographa bjoerkii]
MSSALPIKGRAARRKEKARAADAARPEDKKIRTRLDLGTLIKQSRAEKTLQQYYHMMRLFDRYCQESMQYKERDALRQFFVHNAPRPSVEVVQRFLTWHIDSIQSRLADVLSFFSAKTYMATL